jgi:hypothetical protein
MQNRYKRISNQHKNFFLNVSSFTAPISCDQEFKIGEKRALPWLEKIIPTISA